MTESAFAFATALVASAGLTPAARRIALATGFVDRPDARKLHHDPTPLLGGLAMYAGAALTALLFAPSEARVQVLAILGGAGLLLLVGTLDDRGLLHHQIKLFGAMPLAALILAAAGIRTEILGALGLPLAADMALSVLWVVGVTAAFSILDHMDGLCGGVAAVAGASFLALALLGGQVLVAVLAAALFGAALGFLRWNFRPARIFMGDGGAMFLGFSLAALALKLRTGGDPRTAWVVPVLVLAAPILDTTLVTISRSRRGLMPFAAPGKDHAAHRLSNLGLGQRGAVLALYGVGLLGGAAALWLRELSGPALLGAGAVCGALVLTAVAALERAPYERQERPLTGRSVL